MKRYNATAIGLLCASLVAAAVCWMWAVVVPYYRPATPQPPFRIAPLQQDDSIRVLFLGDSWAAYHNYRDTLLEKLIEQHTSKMCRVISKGYVGVKSKGIYERMHGDARSLLESRPDFCIVSAGINDAVAKMGPGFYKANYRLILELLISVGITPVVLDMPDLDYYGVYRREPLSSRLRHRLSALITGADMYSFSAYRTSLRNMIEACGWADSVIYINAEEWLPSGEELFMPDDIHLNHRGYDQLDQCLARRLHAVCTARRISRIPVPTVVLPLKFKENGLENQVYCPRVRRTGLPVSRASIPG